MADEQSTQTAAPENAEGTPAPERTFTQADLDRVVQDRLARERAKYEGFDDLKAKAAEFDKLQEQQLSELERERKAREALEAENKSLAERSRETALRAAVIAESAKRNIVDPDAAVALLDRQALEFGEDGTPTNVAKTVEALIEARPYLVASTTARPNGADQGARGGGPKQVSESELHSMSPEAIVQAQKDGRLDSLLKGT